jgi:peptidyl-prolyl cis-trans isomerase A (cyclophilin A)
MRGWWWAAYLVSACLCGCGEPAPSGNPPVPGAPALGVSSNTPKAPAKYRVLFETTKGNFIVEVHRDWSPNGADRFYEAVQAGVYNKARFFRAVKGFMVQFGIPADPAVSEKWKENRISDDPMKESNRRGTITFAKPGAPNSRTTQVFINYGDNSRLDAMGFSPFGEVVEGMEVVDSFNQQYGEETTKYQGQMYDEGNTFLDKAFPGLDEIVSATIVESP